MPADSEGPVILESDTEARREWDASQKRRLQLGTETPSKLTSLLQCIASSGSTRSFICLDKLEEAPPRLSSQCNAQFDFLRSFVKHWRASPLDKFHIPGSWTGVPDELYADHIAANDWLLLDLRPWTSALEECIHPLSYADLIRNSSDPNSWCPDFLLARPQRRPELLLPWIQAPPLSVDSSLRLNSVTSMALFNGVISYVGLERAAESAIPGALTNTPGCWLRQNPLFDFPSELEANSCDLIVDFALVLNVFGSSALPSADRASSLRVSLTHPALVVGVKGPAVWEESQGYSSDEDEEIPKKTLADIRSDLGRTVQSSLDAHLMNWSLRQPDHHLDTIPPWLMVFGVIYDAEYLRIIAHMPYIESDSQDGSPRLGYVSSLIDEIPYHSKPDVHDRTRAGLAMLALQRHAFRLSCLWEKSAEYWPPEIQEWELMREAEYRPDVEPGMHPFPDDRGSWPPQDDEMGSEEEYSDCSEDTPKLGQQLEWSDAMSVSDEDDDGCGAEATKSSTDVTNDIINWLQTQLWEPEVLAD